MCQAVECSRPVVARGLCTLHYKRARRRGEFVPSTRRGAGLDFLRALPVTEDCIEWPFGPKARLSEALVASIRERVRAGEKQSDVAKDVGVSPQAVNHIVKGRTWQADEIRRVAD